MQQIDQSVLFFLNGLHNQFFDRFFWYATKPEVYLPLYFIGMVLAYRQFGKKIWLLLFCIVLMALLTEQCCEIIKDAVCRLRPTHNPNIAPLIHIVNDYRGGKYGFPSAHACNTFGVAAFLYCIMSPKYWSFKWGFFTWAAMMAYSRIYLGVHYPLDILCGAGLGVSIGLGTAMLATKTFKP